MNCQDNNIADEQLGSGITEVNLKTPRNKKVVTVPLPDPIAKNIEAITSLHTKESQNIPAHQQIIENTTKFFGRAAFLYSLLAILAFWIFGNLFKDALPFNLPPFHWSEQGLDAASLLISTGVLIRQTRQEKFAEQRSQLMLQLNLLSEQKIAKIIALLEELRADLPDVIDRHDAEAQVMQEAADPFAVLEALEENLTQELELNSSSKSLSDEERSLESVSPSEIVQELPIVDTEFLPPTTQYKLP